MANKLFAYCVDYTVLGVSVGLPLLWMRMGPSAFTGAALTLVTWHLHRNSHTGVWEYFKCSIVLSDQSCLCNWIAYVHDGRYMEK